MESMVVQNDFMDDLHNPEKVQRIDHLVEDIYYALMEYQVCTCIRPGPTVPNIYARLHFDRTSMTRAVKKL